MQKVIWWSSYTNFRVFISLEQFAEEKGPNTSNNGQGYFAKNQSLQFHIFLKFNEISLLSKSHLNVELHLF